MVDEGKAIQDALDELNREIADLEYAVGDLGIRQRVFVSLEGGARLAYGKAKGSWGFLYAGVDGAEIPLSSASAGRRVEAAARLPDLLAELRATSAARAAEVRRAAAALREFRRSLG